MRRGSVFSQSTKRKGRGHTRTINESVCVKGRKCRVCDDEDRRCFADREKKEKKEHEEEKESRQKKAILRGPWYYSYVVRRKMKSWEAFHPRIGTYAIYLGTYVELL